MDVDLCSAFPMFWPLKVPYKTCHIYPFTHILSLMAEANISNFGAKIQTLDNPLYLLSYSRPYLDTGHLLLADLRYPLKPSLSAFTLVNKYE